MAIEINGTTGISGVNGSATTPALQGQDTNTGISFGTDEVNIVTNGEIQAKVDSSGRVLIGQNDTTGVDAEADDLVVSSTAHTGITVRSGSNHNASVYFADQDAVRQGRIEYNHPNNYMRFNTDGTERLRITSNGTLRLNSSPGIDFSQIQTNATGVISETLDSFEHGSWEARLRFGTTTEIGTYSTNSSAEYVKIGNIVHVSGFTRYDSVNTGNSGILTMDLPFAVDEHGQPHNWVYPGSAVPSHSDLMTKGFHALCGNAGAARSRFGFYNSTSGSIDYVENGDLSGWNGNTRSLHFNFSYQTNA